MKRRSVQARDALAEATTFEERTYVQQGAFRGEDGIIRSAVGPESDDQDDEGASDLKTLARRLEQARNTLTWMERLILNSEWAPDALARLTGLSVERVQDLKARAQAKLRESLESPPANRGEV